LILRSRPLARFFPTPQPVWVLLLIALVVQLYRRDKNKLLRIFVELILDIIKDRFLRPFVGPFVGQVLDHLQDRILDWILDDL
jgi:hypothetical protein